MIESRNFGEAVVSVLGSMSLLRGSCVALVGAAAAWLGCATSGPATRVAPDRGCTAEIAALEARVAAQRDDSAALSDLVDAYLATGSPGLAEAAIDRAPTSVRALPQVADARARTLADLGLAAVALSVQRGALQACAERPCTRTLVARAERRAEWLSELVRLGVDDAASEPRRARIAYHLAVREVRLEAETAAPRSARR